MAEIAIQMPQLGEAVAEALVLKILIKEGEDVKADDVIMEVETSKAVMEVTAVNTGVISKMLAIEGETYSVGMALGYIHTEDDDATNSKKEEASDQSSDNSHFNQEAKLDNQKNNDSEEISDLKLDDFQKNNIESLHNNTIKVNVPPPSSAYLSPRMKSRIEEMGLNDSDMAGIAGSGKGGRITIDDFENYLRKIEKSRISKASPMRVAVADSMRRSWLRPLATIGMSVNLDNIIEHRKITKPKPGITVYAIKALALALAQNLAPAGRLVGNRIIHPSKVDIGFAVEVEDGVIVPVVHDADKKSLNDIVTDYENSLSNSKSRKPSKNQTLETGIATVTNYSNFKINWATPIPLPEQNFVLGVGIGKKVPFWDRKTKSFVPITEAELTLSFDHRLLDGGGAGRLLSKIIKYMSHPEKL